MSKKQRYNLPGYGYITYQLFPYAQRLYDLAAYYGHIDRFQNINQLGSLRNVFEGAHHTRWEYVISQLAIITELCYLKGEKDLPVGTGATNSSFGGCEDLNCDPTNGDLLQMLVLLTNMGHLPGTFATERAFMHKLRRDREFLSVFKAGLPKSFRPLLEEVISNNKIYSISYYISAFFVRRFISKESSKEIVDMCHNLLLAYLCKEEQFQSHIQLSKSIRRLAYLSLDSLYTPVPFSLDLTSIFLSLESYLKDVFRYDSVFQNAMGGLEGVMRDSIYLSPASLIQIASFSKTFVREFEAETTSVYSIGDLKKTFGPMAKWKGDFFEAFPDKNMARSSEKIIKITFDSSSDQPNGLIGDTVEWERRKTQRVGIQSCQFGAERDPSGKHLAIAAKCRGDNLPKAIHVARELTHLMIEADNDKTATANKWPNAKRIMSFIQGHLFGFNYEYRYKSDLPIPLVGQKGKKLLPVYISDGARSGADAVKAYYHEAERYFANNLDPHAESHLNEVKVMQLILEEYKFRGRLLAYWGSSYIVKQQGDRIAEFDGIVYVLGARPEDRRIILLEAKNTSGNNAAAENQLRDALMNLRGPAAPYNMHDVSNKGVYACIPCVEQAET